MKKVKKAQVGVKKVQTATVKKSAPAAPKATPKATAPKEKSWFQKAKDFLDRAVEANNQVDSLRGEHLNKIMMGKSGPAKPVKKQKLGGKNLPDFSKDGKITKKDVLIGRGVLPKPAKKGKKVAAKKMMKGGKCKYGCK